MDVFDVIAIVAALIAIGLLVWMVDHIWRNRL